MKHFTTSLIGALILYAISSDGVAAAPRDEVPTQVVRFGDLDLAQPAGARELYRRIRLAADDVCDPPAPGSFATWLRNRACTDQAVAHAVADVGAPLLIARYEAVTGRQILQPPQARLNR